MGVTEKYQAKDADSYPVLKNLDSLLGGLFLEALSEEDFTGKAVLTVLRVAGLGSRELG